MGENFKTFYIMSHKQSARKCSGGFEIAISRKDLRIKGKCRIYEKRSTAGFKESPRIKYPKNYAKTNGLIQYDQPWLVAFKWKVSGPLACLLDCGYWKNQVIFELMGGGETHFKPEVVTQDIGQPGHVYRAAIHIKAGALKPGVYRVICCTQFCLKDGSPGPIAGFKDKGLIKIYKDKKVVYRPQADLAVVENGEG